MGELLIDISGVASLAPGTAFGANLVLITVLGFVLGFAMNRGSICSVIATRELVLERKPARFIALFECAAWAALVYAILEATPMVHVGWSSLAYLVPAAILLGIGTYVNGACVFGSVGHIGNGEIEFAFTFLGISAVIYIETVFDLFADPPPAVAPPSLEALLPALALLAILGLRFGVSRRSAPNFRRLTLAMGSIGITSTVLAILAPEFSITASFGPLASIPVAGAVISVSMFAGSFFSARLRRQGFRLRRPATKAVVKRTLAGMLMGLGALLIPGGNDTLLLIGLPTGAWQAALAYLLFFVTLVALIAKRGSAAKAWS